MSKKLNHRDFLKLAGVSAGGAAIMAAFASPTPAVIEKQV